MPIAKESPSVVVRLLVYNCVCVCVYVLDVHGEVLDNLNSMSVVYNISYSRPQLRVLCLLSQPLIFLRQ